MSAERASEARLRAEREGMRALIRGEEASPICDQFSLASWKRHLVAIEQRLDEIVDKRQDA